MMSSQSATLDGMASLVLVCASFSVVSTPCGDVPLMWEPDRRAMDEMLLYLHESTLFPCGITSDQLALTLCSLEMLFSCEADSAGDSVRGSPLPEESRMVRYRTEERDIQMRRYDYFGIHETSSILGRGGNRLCRRKAGSAEGQRLSLNRK